MVSSRARDVEKTLRDTKIELAKAKQENAGLRNRILQKRTESVAQYEAQVRRLQDKIEIPGLARVLNNTDEKLLLNPLPDVPSSLVTPLTPSPAPKTPTFHHDSDPDGGVALPPAKCEPPPTSPPVKSTSGVKRAFSDSDAEDPNKSHERIIVCIPCYRNRRRCDAGEPCQSCVDNNEKKCCRARCEDYKMDMCKRQGCLRAHQNDENSYLNMVSAGHVSRTDSSRKKPKTTDQGNPKRGASRRGRGGKGKGKGMKPGRQAAS